MKQGGRKKGTSKAAKRHYCEECLKAFEDYWEFKEHKCQRLNY